MPKDAKKNVDRYKIRGGDLNEFEFHQNQTAFAEAQTAPTSLIPGTPPEAKALRIQPPAKKAQKKRSTKKSTKSSPAKTVGTKKSRKRASSKKSAKPAKRAGAKGATAKKSAAKKAAKSNRGSKK